MAARFDRFLREWSMHPTIPAGLALALAAPLGASAQPAADVAALKQEIEAIRASYEQRLHGVEQRLQAAEAALKAQQAAAAPPPAAAPVAQAAPPARPGAPAGANAFNPAISLILSGTYGRTTRDPATYSITGFAAPPGASLAPAPRSFSLGETELGFAASIDPWWSGVATFAIEPDDHVGVENAFVQTTSLGHGLTAKAGRFFSGIGYLNEQHAHTWDFVDAPLAYQAFLGGQFADDGMQLRWLAPTDTYLEIGAELGRGRTFPASNAGSNGARATALYAHTGGDIGDSGSWRAGLSLLHADPGGLQLASAAPSGATLTSGAFSGRNRVTIADFVWKWAPNGNATRTNLKLQGEYLRSARDGTFTDASASVSPVNTAQSGWYLQGVYQFMPHWRVGLRTEGLDSGALSTLTPVGYRPRKDSLMVDFSASEFSRIRLQFARDRSRLGLADNQFFVQYQMSLGAHGAHIF
jgi:hypothetical protein